MSLDEVIDAEIKSGADWVRKQIMDGKLYGRPIDMDNPDAVVLASYLAGKTDARASHAADIARLALLEQP